MGCIEFVWDLLIVKEAKLCWDLQYKNSASKKLYKGQSGILSVEWLEFFCQISELVSDFGTLGVDCKVFRCSECNGESGFCRFYRMEQILYRIVLESTI